VSPRHPSRLALDEGRTLAWRKVKVNDYRVQERGFYKP